MPDVIEPGDPPALAHPRWRWFAGLAVIVAVALGALFFARSRTPGPRTRDEPGQRGEREAMADMPGMDGGTSDVDAGGAVPQHADLTIGPEIQQRIGVTLGKVKNAPLEVKIRTVGIVRPDETKMTNVQLKTEGWVEALFVNYTGQRVKKGDPLLSIYSPAFLTTQQDYLRARSASGAAGVLPDQSLYQSALERLRLWDVPADEISRLERTRHPMRTLTLRSRVTGTVIEKKAFVGQQVTAGEVLYTLADLSTVWVQAKIYENELAHISVGQPATISLAVLPEKKFEGKVVFIAPVLDQTARTVEVRIALPNPRDEIKPNMFASVELTHPMGEAVLVPTSAVIRTGERDIAYRVEGDDRFVPVEVKIAPDQFGDNFQVLSGLKAGEVVVTSANFLIDSESRLQSGGGNMAGMAGMDMPGKEKGGGGKDGTKGAEPKGTKGAEPKSGDMKGMKMGGEEKKPE
jgi:Cu(I)/Ag(I) efflux system membrane fusion protein